MGAAALKCRITRITEHQPTVQAVAAWLRLTGMDRLGGYSLLTFINLPNAHFLCWIICSRAPRLCLPLRCRAFLRLSIRINRSTCEITPSGSSFKCRVSGRGGGGCQELWHHCDNTHLVPVSCDQPSTPHNIEIYLSASQTMWGDLASSSD